MKRGQERKKDDEEDEGFGTHKNSSPAKIVTIKIFIGNCPY